MAEAHRLGLAALALTDHHGFYGVVRFAEAARACGSADGLRDRGDARPGQARARASPTPPGRTSSCSPAIPRATPASRPCWPTPISRAGRRGGRSSPSTPWPRAAGGHWLVLSGCRKGAVPAALMDAGPRAASREVGRLVDAFGRANVALELWDHGDPLDTARNDALAHLAVEWGRRRRGHQQRALRHAGRVPARHHARRRAGAPPAGRAGGLAAVGPVGLPARARPSSPVASPAGPASSSAPPSWGAPAPSTCAWWRRGCPTSPSPRAWTSRATCASW